MLFNIKAQTRVASLKRWDCFFGKHTFKMAANMADKTGSKYISASRQDSNAVLRNNPPFSGSRNSAELLGILPDVTGSRKLKMATVKPELLISQPLDKIATRFQRLTPIFGVHQLSDTIANTVRCDRK